MRFLDVSFPSPEDNLLFDDVLLRSAESGGAPETLRLWESPRLFIVLGRAGKVEEDVNLAAAAAGGVPVLRRSSGGGTVLQGPGCLNFSLVLNKQRGPEFQDIRKSYRRILDDIIRLLNGLNVLAEFRPVSDLVVPEGERKFSGNAQKRGRNFILHHGTLLYDFQLDLIERYLHPPAEAPVYRRGRPHSGFVTNIPLDPVRVKQAFQSYYRAEDCPQGVPEREMNLLAELKLRGHDHTCPN